MSKPTLTPHAARDAILAGESFPEGLQVSGGLYLSGCTSLAALPDNLQVSGGLYLSGCTSLRSVAGVDLPTKEEADARIVAVAKAALASPDALDMDSWHRCETTHSIAGWAIHLAGEQGYALEKRFGPRAAGAILLGPAADDMFDASNEAARDWLQVHLAAAPASGGAA
jgi:hypothetical protein